MQPQQQGQQQQQRPQQGMMGVATGEPPTVDSPDSGAVASTSQVDSNKTAWVVLLFDTLFILPQSILIVFWKK